MNFLKPFISLLLLLTYSFGFAHNLVPHCTDFTNENHTASHNHHTTEADDEHSHITHNDHFDEGFYDYLVCLVHETETPESECSEEHCFTINNNPNFLKTANKLHTTIVLFAVFQPIVQNEPITYFSTDVEINYLSPPLEDPPHRGPPRFSC
jgi:hypothetical protein